MSNTNDEDNSVITSLVRPGWESPWPVALRQDMVKGIRANATRRLETAQAFREVQREAYRSWDAWDREFDEEAAANDNGDSPD